MPESMKAVDAALDRVASRMTTIVRNRAVEMGWPKEVAGRMSMIRSANGIGVDLADEVAEQAKDLEFGSPTSAPRSVFATLHSPQTKKEVEKIAGDSMDELIDRIRSHFK